MTNMLGNSNVRFAIAIPQFVRQAGFDRRVFAGFMSRAEALGFVSAWAQEQVLGTMPNLDSTQAMTLAAAHTESMRIGCAVFVTPLHNPVHLAKGISSLDHVSGGRLEVGVGFGGQRMFSAFDIADPTSLVARFNEGLRLMKALWTEERIDFEGRFWQLNGAAMEPKPLQKPHPPIWFGGSHPNALRRAVRDGDGFFGAGSQPTETFAQLVPIVREALAEQGRDPATFRVAKRVYVAVDDDGDRARERIGSALHDLYGFFGTPDLTPVAVAGAPDDCARGLREVADAGAQLILLNPLFDEAEQMERLVAEVVPKLL